MSVTNEVNRTETINEFISPKEKEISYLGHTIRFCNQRSYDWTHLYEYEGNGNNLTDAGCGVFSLVHIIEWMHGIKVAPEEAADISQSVGGRGDDGTDRPVMMKGMCQTGYGDKYGFGYDGAGNINDHEKLYAHIKAGNAAMCNLRPGHIVALVEAREIEGKKQYLVIDSNSESSSDRVKESVCQVIEGSEIYYHPVNKSGAVLGYNKTYGMFWVDEEKPMEFTLVYRK